MSRHNNVDTSQDILQFPTMQNQNNFQDGTGSYMMTSEGFDEQAPSQSSIENKEPTQNRNHTVIYYNQHPP